MTMSKNTGDGELEQIILRALMTTPNNMQEKIINDKSLTVFEVQQYNHLVSAVKKYAAQEANKAQRQLLKGLMEQKKEFESRIDDVPVYLDAIPAIVIQNKLEGLS